MKIENRSQSSYRNIFKATSLFGGIQIYQIIIQIIKSKIVAVLLGPAGFGIMGLFQSALDLIKSLTNMGLAQSAVRDVSEANGSGDIQHIAKTVTVLRKLVWLTGLLGLVTMTILSPILSKTTFGNYDYTIPFVILSITLLLEQLSSGQRIVLQGLRKLNSLAKVSAIGSTLGLIVSTPIYYWLRIEGIIPTLILNSFSALIISWWFSRKVKVNKIEISPKQTFEHGKKMLQMGIALSTSGILFMGTSYILRSYIRDEGGTEEVGLFHAGYAIMSSYVSLIFNAIATDYYPRLATVNKDNSKCKEVVSQQGEIATMIMAPLICIFLIIMPFMLQILYSDKFLPANDFIIWCCLGMMFKLSSWLIAFLFVAKAESRLFIINELIGNCYYLFFSLIGYKLWGVKGLGIGFTANYLVYLLQVYLISYKRYRFTFSISFIKTYTFQLAIVIVCLVIALNLTDWMRYTYGFLFIILSTFTAFRGLNNRLQFISLIKQKFIK